MNKIIIIVVLVMCLISCTSDKRNSISPVCGNELNAQECFMAKEAFSVFSDTCRPLMNKYTSDIESIRIESGFDRDPNIPRDGCLDYRCKEYGWDKQISVKIKLKDKLDVIPSKIRASGHTLYFYLGGPKNPGYTVGKFPELCGAQGAADGSYDKYISEPKLSFIKQ